MPPRKKTDWQNQREMTPQQYYDTIFLLGMNITQAARYLGVSERTSHRYARGEAGIPTATILFLRCMVAQHVLPRVPEWVSDRR